MSDPTPTADPAPTSSAPPKPKGIIAWAVANKITPNLLMIVLIGGGLFMTTRIKQEVFPSFELDIVTVSVAYPGASPEEVETGIVVAVEEAVRGIADVKEVRSSANEGSGSVTVELEEGSDQARAYQEIQQAIDRLQTLPVDAERPTVSRVARRREVIDLMIYGDVPEAALREVVEQVSDQLQLSEGITQVEIEGARDFEVHVEVPQETLRAHGLSLQDVARAIQTASVELPAGRVETSGGEILLRTRDRRDWAREFATVPIRATESGSVLRLSDIAQVKEGFEEATRVASYDGKRAIGLEIFRVGEQTPIGVSDAVRAAMAKTEKSMPDGVHWAITADRSDIYRQRLELLLKNAFLGLVLVLVVLGLFLELRLAFWVTMGIPTSFLGALLFLGPMGVSINMISMFAFIVALGIVVDDAIIAGENIHEFRTQGHTVSEAAIKGARDVALPIGFSILSNIVAFLPLYFIPGMMGKIWKVIPVVVSVVFLISWVESLFILPAHLTHAAPEGPPGVFARIRGVVARSLGWLVERVYMPILRVCLRWRGITIAAGFALLFWAIGYIAGGHIGTTLMPRVESDSADVTAVLPAGSPPARVAAVRDRLISAIQKVGAANGGDTLLEGTYARIRENEIRVRAYLTDPETRPIGTREVTRLWREETGPLLGLDQLRYQFDRGGPGSGASLTVELSHRDIPTLENAASALAASLLEFPNVKDVDDGRAQGKPQLDFTLKPAGESLGLTSAAIGQQVRNAFQGAEALRQQRQRHEIRVRVRRPESERVSAFDIESLLIIAPNGTWVPLREVAEVHRGRAFTSIERRDGRRTVTVSADVDPVSQTDQVMATMNASVLPEMAQRFPGLSYGYEGRQSEMRESTSALWNGFLLALVIIYFLLAVPFRSYIQPMVVMIAIPFGVVGAVIGHMALGYSLSLISMMGMVALSGVVVNDSLVLVEYANRRRAEGMSPAEAMIEAGRRRFRPVLLTTLTTFGGLAPMIFETSRQARFLVPMALSLGFGILFATVVTLIIVPSLYALLEDAANWVTGRTRHPRHRAPASAPSKT